MKTGRPRKLTNPVTVTVMMEEKARTELDEMRGNHSRGKYISILSISDNLKTRKILDLKDEVQKLEEKIKELLIIQDTDLKVSFRKAIYSNYRNYAINYIDEKMSYQAKKLWCEKLQVKPHELKEFLW